MVQELGQQLQFLHVAGTAKSRGAHGNVRALQQRFEVKTKNTQITTAKVCDEQETKPDKKIFHPGTTVGTGKDH